MEVHHRWVEFDVVTLCLDPLTVAGEPVFQGVLASRQPTGLTAYVSSETVLGHGRNLAARGSGVVLVEYERRRGMVAIAALARVFVVTCLPDASAPRNSVQNH